MLLVMAIIHGDHAHKIKRKLMDNDFRITTLSSSGGFLKAGNETLLLGIENERLDELVAVLREECDKVNVKHGMKDDKEVPINTANLFVMNMEQFKKM